MKQDVAIPSFNILSICTGIGGLDLGVKLATRNSRTVCYVEREAKVVEVLARRIEEGRLDEAPVWSDLRTFDCGRWRGLVDCVVGGYPCQPFSVMGKRRGEQDPRHLWPHVRRVTEEAGAPYLFCENVENHLSVGFFEVASELREMGYECEAILLGAAEVGAPHSRNRLFFMAYNESLDAHDGEREKRIRLKGGKQAGGLDSVLGKDKPPENPFPPGKSFEFWEEVLRRDPLSVPAFPHTDDGLSSELGGPRGKVIPQIRGLGNSVVPVAAAFAFDVLLRRIHDRV